MAVSAADIKWYLSGGTGNTSHAASHGDAISTTEVVTNSLFDDVSSAEASSGDTEYRCIYVKNTNGTDTLFSARVFIQAETGGSSNIQIALDGVGKNATAEIEANESTAPTGESFSDAPVDYANGLVLGDLAPADYYAIWIKRVVSASATSGTYTYTLRVQGDTA